MSTPAGSAASLCTTTVPAFERTRVAYERTMMAWVRTATSLITFGFSVYKFFQIESTGFAGIIIGPRGFGIRLIGIGLFSLLLGAGEHWRDLSSLRHQCSGMPRSVSVWVGLAVGALGLVALLAVLMKA